MRPAIALISLMCTTGLSAEAPRTFRDCADCPEMIALPPGRFMMGSTDVETAAENEPEQFARWEKPRHEVSLAYSFALGRTEVTVAQYAAFIAATGERPGAGCAEWDFEKAAWDRNPARTWRDPMHPSGGDHPVVCVDWSDAKAYAAWLAARTGKPYRLASEAEWEYAARAGTATARFWGDDRHAACAHANVYDLDGVAGWGDPPKSAERYSNCRDGYVFTAPVASYAPNAFGLYDMLGNVFEWLEDCFHESYDGAPNDGSAWVSGACRQRAARGGSWSSTPRNLRSAWRERDAPDFRYVGIGFRVAVTLPKEETP